MAVRIPIAWISVRETRLAISMDSVWMVGDGGWAYFSRLDVGEPIQALLLSP